MALSTPAMQTVKVFNLGLVKHKFKRHIKNKGREIYRLVKEDHNWEF